MTEATHEHRWAGWWPSTLSTAAAVAREQRQCMDCQLVEDRPVAAPETALGRCRASVAVEDALRACERQHGDVPTPLTERIRQVLRDTPCDRHEAREAG